MTPLYHCEMREPGHSPDDTGFGAVAYPFRINKYDLTAAQYVEFLNAKGQADRDGGLWNNDMDSTRSGDGVRCAIWRSGESGRQVYSVPSGL